MSLRFPAEWEPHEAVWIGFPSDDSLWEDNLSSAQDDVARFVRAIVRPDPEDPSVQGEHVHLVISHDAAEVSARKLLGDVITSENVSIERLNMGDVWLRDTGPLFLTRAGKRIGGGFAFNGWGGKYDLGDDKIIAQMIADRAALPLSRHHWIAEGGAIETDGAGTLITTRQCLLNPNRNPGVSEAKMTKALCEVTGAEHVIWLDEGLAFDHTDGHVDNIVRFLAPGIIGTMRASGSDDPNAELYASLRKQLSKARLADGSKPEIVEIASPGRVTDEDGEIIPASHMNFYIANHSVIIPIYAQTDEQMLWAEDAVDTLAEFIGRPHIYAINAPSLLTGGGSFHCISQQVPAL